MRRFALPALLALTVTACGDADTAPPPSVNSAPAPLPSSATPNPPHQRETPTGEPTQPRSRRDGPTYDGKTY